MIIMNFGSADAEPFLVSDIPTFWGWILGQQGAIVLSILAAGVFAWLQIRAAKKQSESREQEGRDIARKRATIDLLAARTWDQDFILNRNAYMALRDADDELTKWAGKAEELQDNQRIINRALGDYELVAVGIKSNILDEEFYRSWYESTLLYDYRQTQSYLSALNDPQNTPHGNEGKYFREFQELARKWQREKG